jgi:outer membrane protein assembly factor BamB
MTRGTIPKRLISILTFAVTVAAFGAASGVPLASSEELRMQDVRQSSSAQDAADCNACDVDDDGDVDVQDIQAVANRWLCPSGEPCYEPQYDLNNDGIIDVADVMTVSQNWGCEPTSECDWPTVHRDAARSGHSPCEVKPPAAEAWTKTWDGEMMATRMEAIVADGKVFVGTYAGRMRALDARNGDEIWTFETDSQAGIAHSPAVSDGVVVFGDVGGSIYGLDVDTGGQVWKFSGHGPGGFLTSPAIDNGRIYMGSQDGYFYALELSSGAVAWEYQTGSAILNSAAVRDGRVYVGTEDMHAYALEGDTGNLIWRSEKLNGVSMRDYYPVLADDTVIFRTVPLTNFKKEDLEPDGEFLEALNAMPEQEQDAIIDRLESNPYLQTFHALDVATGQEKFVAPVLYGPAGNGGSPSPPVVMSDGRVVTYYRTDRSVWELGDRPRHSNISIGLVDLSTGRIEQIRHNQGDSNNAWGTAWWCIGDETAVLAGGGNLIYNTHQGGVSSVDVDSGAVFPLLNARDTWGGHDRPIWAANEWHGVARGSVSISEDSYYWIVGSRVIAVRGG